MLVHSLLLFLLLGGQSNAPIVINEFSYDDSPTTMPDDREFVELYNRSGGPVNIGNWVLEHRNSTGIINRWTIPAGTTLLNCQFYVMGSGLGTVPNLNQQIGFQDIFSDGTAQGAAIVLYDGQNNIVDTVSYETNKGIPGPSYVEGDGVWGNFSSIDTHETAIARMRDGYDTDNNRDFVMIGLTPGTTNNLPVQLPVFTETYSSYLVDDNLGAQWFGSFTETTVADPLNVTSFNPASLPSDSSSAGGSGGNCAIMWDPAGGGNCCVMKTDGVTDVQIELLVYLESTLFPPGAQEGWSIGVQGTSWSYANIPDPHNTFGFTACGDTGIAWVYERTSSFVQLSLVDFNDGGTQPTLGWIQTPQIVLGGPIAILPGVNDGWRRLCITVVGTSVVGEFGGILGQAGSGTTINGVASQPALGGIYMAYREAEPMATAGVRPITFDDLTVVDLSNAGGSGTIIQTIGFGAMSSAGTPKIRANRIPSVGDLGWRLDISGCVPAQSTFLYLGFSAQPAPINLGLIGGPASSNIYINLGSGFALGTDVAGNAVFPVGIPCIEQIRGVRVFWQDFDLDLSQPFVLPIFSSAGLSTQIQ